jgi:hypothetical protein
MVNNGWNTIDFQYKAATLGVPPAPAMVGPTPGTVLPGPIVLFQWSGNGTAVSSWWLYAGSTLGGREYFDSGSLSTLSVTVNGLPTNGSTVYVRLWHGIAGAWSSSDYNYKAANIGGGPAIVAPVPGSKLPGSSATFQWTANGTSVTNWWLYAGSTVGGRNYYDSGALGTSLATTVVGLPTNGTTVYVRLWYMTGGTWQTRDYQYTAP